MNDKERKLDVGDDSVVIGDVPGKVGDRSVRIGATDAQGNTILNRRGSMAIGHNAHAGPDSIAIGANAGAGMGPEMLLHELGKVIAGTNDPDLIASFAELSKALKEPVIDKERISGLWGTIKNAAVLAGAVELLEKVGSFIASLIR